MWGFRSNQMLRASHFLLKRSDPVKNAAIISSKQLQPSCKRSFARVSYGQGMAPDKFIWGLIGANTAVFFMWQNVSQRWMIEHFTLSWDGIKQGRLHTLLTSAFSQYDSHHFLMNMFTLYFFGQNVAPLLGTRRFGIFYLSAAAISSLTALAYETVVPYMNIPASFRPHERTISLGASGAVNATVMASIIYFPRNPILLFFVLPVPAALVGLGFVATDLYGAWRGTGNVGYAAHLGGAATGIVYGLITKRRYFGRW